MAEPPEDPWDDEPSYSTPMSRLSGRVGAILAAILAIALVLPAAGRLISEIQFRLGGEDVARVLDSPAGPDLAQAVFLVNAVGCAGQRSGTGSAFAVRLDDDLVLLTNRHVVEGAQRVGVRGLGGETDLMIAEVRLAGSEDVAVLVPEDPGDVPALRISDEPPSEGASVRLVGFPAAMPFTTEGTVAEVMGGRVLLEIETDPGASGSPVVDADGAVVAQIRARTGDGRGVATSAPTVLQAAQEAVPVSSSC